MTILFIQTWSLGDCIEDEAVTEDAANIVRAAFAELARDPGATSASFRVANGVVVHRHSAAGVSNRGYGSANGVTLDQVDSEDQDDMWMDGGELGSWPELSHAWSKQSSCTSFRKGHAALRRLSGFWVAVGSQEGAESISQMV